MKHRDSNENGCDWYADRQNFLECGEHDVPPTFIANEMCCTCKEIQGIKSLPLRFSSALITIPQILLT